MITFLAFLICIIATAVGAISGIGGGILIKPALDAMLGLPAASISFLSGCTVLAMTIVSLLHTKKEELLPLFDRIIPLAIGSAIGGVAGKWVFDLLCVGFSDHLVGITQNALIILLTAGVFVYVLHKDNIQKHNIQSPAVSMLIGLALGTISAFLGIGGGPINLIVLYHFFSMDTKTAAICSIFSILFSQMASLATTLAMTAVPPIDGAMLLVMVLGGIAGGASGRSISKRLTNSHVDRLFRCLLIIIILISAYNVFQFSILA